MYDLAAFPSLVSNVVADKGRVIWGEASRDHLSFLLCPMSPESGGTPIFVKIIEDEALILCGLDSQVLLSWNEEGDEQEVVDVLRSIISGGAREFALIKRGYDFKTELDVHTPTYVDVVDERLYTFLRYLPPW